MLSSGIARLSGSAVFSPKSQFSTGQLGAWYDPSTFANLFQDSAGTTPATTVGQLVGRMLDGSGRGNVITQPTTSARPLIGTASGVQYLTFDGLDDGLAGAITLGADMDCFIAVRRNSAKTFVLLYDNPTTVAVGVGDSADPGPSNGAALGGTFAVNGVAVAGGTATTRQQLAAAIPVSSFSVVEIKNVNLSAFASLGFGGFSFGYQLNGDIAGIILCPAGDATARQKNRQYLGAKVGLTLP